MVWNVVAPSLKNQISSIISKCGKEAYWLKFESFSEYEYESVFSREGGWIGLDFRMIHSPNIHHQLELKSGSVS